MSAWYLVACLIALRTEINLLAPSRDKASDGSIGDTAHSSRSSDHNPAADGGVHAIDVDKDLRAPGWSMDRIVQIIVTRCRAGLETRLQYVIWKGRIWSRSWGWTAREYTGPNRHDKHAHFSARYVAALERDTRPWGLLAAARPAKPIATPPLEDDMPTAAEIAAAVWEHKLANGSKAGGQLVTLDARSNSTENKRLPALAVAVSQLAAGQVDANELAAVLAPAIADAVIARLPEDQDNVTAEELQAAVVGAARELLGAPPA